MRWRFEYFSYTRTESYSPSRLHVNVCITQFCTIFLSQIVIEFADRYNTALVCHRWCYLACHPRLWLRVDRSVKDLSEPAVFPNIETAVTAARCVKFHLPIRHSWARQLDQNLITFFPCRPGDTILIAAGGIHHASNIQIKKPLCLVYSKFISYWKGYLSIMHSCTSACIPLDQKLCRCFSVPLDWLMGIWCTSLDVNAVNL